MTVFMFHTYISMKSHHTKGGLEGSVEPGRGRGARFARELSSSKDKTRKLGKIFGVSVQKGEQLTHEESV